MSYVPGDFTKPELYENIRDALDAAEKAHGTQGNVIFYLAVADRFFGSVVDRLGKAKLYRSGQGQGREASVSGAASWSKSRSAIAWIPRAS